jgi:hypothetical protein
MVSAFFDKERKIGYNTCMANERLLQEVEMVTSTGNNGTGTWSNVQSALKILQSNPEEQIAAENLQQIVKLAKLGLIEQVRQEASKRESDNTGTKEVQNLQVQMLTMYGNLIPQLLQMLIISKLEEKGSSLNLEMIRTHLEDNWSDLMSAFSQQDILNVLLAVDKIANGYPDLKLVLVDLIISSLDNQAEGANLEKLFNDFETVKAFTGTREPDISEVVQGYPERKALAQGFFDNMGKGVYVRQKITKLNNPPEKNIEKPKEAFILHVDGFLVKQVAQILAHYRGDIGRLLVKFQQDLIKYFSNARVDNPDAGNEYNVKEVIWTILAITK